MSDTFFENLVEFLPKHVSPRPSYLHATIVFIIVGLIVYYLGGGIDIDVNRDNVESDVDRRISEAIRIGVSVILALLVSDTAYSISWNMRNFRINKNHTVYRKWFPKLY